MTLRPPVLLAALALAASARATGAGAAGATGPSLNPYYERTLMGEAGVRCGLFAPPVLASLRAGAAQARAAALGAGAGVQAADAARGRALRKADATACDSAELRIAAQRVRAAFLSWSRQPRLDLPGRGGGWVAERPWKKGARWALSARGALGGRPLTFGLARLAGPGLVLAADSALPDASGAYAARLVMRDGARAPDAYLARDGQPPPQASRAFLAERKGPADPALGAGEVFLFPQAAADALALLDPRESVRLELAFPAAGRDRVVSTLIPVGDFATGRAFLAAGP